jgi:flagellar hook-basal body complex protein FliE
MNSIPGLGAMPGAGQGQGAQQIPASELQALQGMPSMIPGGMGNVGAADGAAALRSMPALGGGSGDSFSNVLGNFIKEVNQKQVDASQTMQSSGNVSLHQVVIAMEEASVSFQLMVEVRNKLLESYQELMRMQI